MRPTVKPAVSPRPVREAVGDLAEWANREVQPALKELRAFANTTSTEAGKVETDGLGNFAPVWTSAEMPTDATWGIRAMVTGYAGGGSGRAVILCAGAAFSSGGSVNLGSQATLWSFVSDPAIQAQFVVSGRQIVLEVCDDGFGPIAFTAVVDTTEVRL